VARADAVADAPVARRLLGVDLVLWRSGPGAVAAAVDRCPHRDARLSGGWLAGCALVCPYHGWEYGPEGTATRIPQLGDGVPIPPGARLATVRTPVRHGWVWACLEPEGAEVLPVPEVPEHGAAGWRVLHEPESDWACPATMLTDPRRALVEWLGDPPAAAAGMVERWRARTPQDGYESKVDAVVGARPGYRGLDGTAGRLGVDDPLGPTVIVAPGLDAMARGPRGDGPGRGGRPADVLRQRAVDRSPEPARWLDRFGTLAAPGFGEVVRRWRVVAPPDYERDVNLARGHAPSFAGGPVAALARRDPELTRYETPVAGLFLTGAATFPGADVWGASGRAAARAVLARA
jgi:nitrite reductase/ring-hydroxylating ferredoxin subunit